MNLPSKFQIGDRVRYAWDTFGVSSPPIASDYPLLGSIVVVSFTKTGVHYDIYNDSEIRIDHSISEGRTFKETEQQEANISSQESLLKQQCDATEKAHNKSLRQSAIEYALADNKNESSLIGRADEIYSWLIGENGIKKVSE